MYYALITRLERRIYKGAKQVLVVVSRKVAADLERYYDHNDFTPLIYHGVDRVLFTTEKRVNLRSQARGKLNLLESDFVLLLVGNDWKNKGLPCVLEAATRLAIPELKILVVGNDTTAPYTPALHSAGLANRVQFLPLRRDVEFYYAAADVYVGPSLEDAFAMPPLEAMACGLPVIVSRQAGVSEVITDGSDGFILEDSRDADGLATLICNLYGDAALRDRLGNNASRTALQYTWDRNAEELRGVIDEILDTRHGVERCATPASC